MSQLMVIYSRIFSSNKKENCFGVPAAPFLTIRMNGDVGSKSPKSDAKKNPTATTASENVISNCDPPKKT
jgi:hypothetical protein